VVFFDISDALDKDWHKSTSVSLIINTKSKSMPIQLMKRWRY
jgi:hypothetical protein